MFPLIPTRLSQHDDAAGPAQPAGFVDDDTTLLLRATVSDPEGEAVQLQVEVQPIGTGFTGAPTGSSGFQVGPWTAEISVPGLLNFTSYHWRARSVDVLGFASAWVSFGANPESAADFSTQSNQPPSIPTGLGQLKTDGVTVIATGSDTNDWPSRSGARSPTPTPARP